MIPIDQIDFSTRLSLFVSVVLFITTMGLIDTLMAEIFWSPQGGHFRASLGMVLSWIPVGTYWVLFYFSGVWLEYDLRYLVPVILGHNLVAPYFIWFAGYLVIQAFSVIRYHRRTKVLALKRRD